MKKIFKWNGRPVNRIHGLALCSVVFLNLFCAQAFADGSGRIASLLPPVSGGDQIVCATSPIQTLTATATVPGGYSVVWYDAATGGNVVTSPILNTVGTRIYYSETTDGSSVSATRTPVMLAISPGLVINIIPDQNSCGPLTLPQITGTNLSGNQAYYTAINKGGTKYNPGDEFNTAGTTTLYAYDEAPAVVNPADLGGGLTLSEDATYDTGTKVADLVSSTDYGYVHVPTIYPAFTIWQGGNQSFIVPRAAGKTYGVFAGKASVPNGQLVTGEVFISMGIDLTPMIVAENGNAGRLCIINTATNKILYETQLGSVGRREVISPTVEGVVSAADLRAGNISILVALKSTGSNLWTAKNLKVSYKSMLPTCPAIQSLNVIMNAVPSAPVSSGGQTVCATNPIQTLTAGATVPAGTTITWYDAPSGGTIVANPVLNTLGTVVYYAEANNGGCTSTSRTPVVLSINAGPKIDLLTDQLACVSYTFPAITGTNLTGNQAYYTQPNGGGTKYLAGASMNTIGTQTLYLYDKAVSNSSCAGNIDVTSNSSMSDNVLLHQLLSITHNFYPRPVNADFWKGTANQVIDYKASEGATRYLNLIGDLQINSDPACTGNLVEVKVGATFKNEGPAAGAGYSGHITIANKLTGVVLYTGPIQPDSKVGVTAAYTATVVVSAADLLAGNLVVILGAETAQSGYKNWTLSNFTATYSYLSETPCPDEKSFQLTINSLPAAPANNGNQEVCAANPVQTLTAAATVPAGTTITWYDALTGGNVIPAPILSTVGTVIYYAEAVSNTCVSATRTPVTLTINQSPVINAITDINACGPFTLPAIAGTNLSGNQAYYTGINKTGSKYSPGDVLSTPGETTLYAYDEILAGAGQNPEAGLTLTNTANLAGGYTNAKLQALWPDGTRGFPRLGTLNGDPAVVSSFAAYAAGAPAGAKFSVAVGKLTLPVGYVNAGDQVLVSIGNGYFRIPVSPLVTVPGYAGQLSIINTATNQLLYQTSFNDLPTSGITPSVSGLVSAADLIAGNIGVYIESARNIWRISGLTAKYQFVSGEAGCHAQQSFKVNVNPIPAAPVAVNQTACADSPVQTLTATVTVPPGSTVVWYDAATAGNVVPAPILNAVGTISYYAETHTGTCISATRTPVVLTINAQPILTIHNPAIVCHPGTIDLTATGITAGSTAGLQLAYFTDAAATIVLANPATVAVSGTYYIKGTNTVTGCSIIAPVVVQFVDKPEVTAVHPDCVSPTGSITITSPLGTGFEYSIDGTTYQAGTVFNNLAAGSYNVTARNTVVPGCVSDPNIIVINATPTTAMPLVVQPGCDQTQGSMMFPVNAAYEYSIDGAAFTASNEFTGLNPGIYSLRSKKAGDLCIADAVSVIINPSAGRPAAPVAADLQACATSPVQTLTAVATVPLGSTLKWYDALTGGNVMSSPILSSTGTIVYYAESNNGTCTSANRTPVRLTITGLPVINAITNKNVCSSFVLPAITGANLSGNQAYYTEINAGGTKYNIGDVFNTIGETTLYAYDKTTVVLPETSCPAETSFNVLIRNTIAGSITSDQTICKNTVPAALASATDGTGSGSLKYRWERSTTDASTGFNIIAGATLAGYAPAALTVTTWFRRTTISFDEGVECESAPTAAVKVTVQNAVIAGTIGISQTICYGSTPATLTGITPAAGSGMISYRWESSTTDATNGFTTILNAISADYSPTALTAATWFRRITLSTDGVSVCESTPTVAVKITIQGAVTPGAISAGQTICNNSTVMLGSVTGGTGAGNISYRWESSTTSASVGFVPVSGAILADYTPSALTATTYFRRITLSTLNGAICESLPTAVTTLTVQDQTTPGVIGTDQTVCAGAAPTPITSVTPGTGSGTVTYRWEQSSASVPAFTLIGGTTAAAYIPGLLTETTWFRRITVSSLNGVLCESEPTALVKITFLINNVPSGVDASVTTAENTTVNSKINGTDDDGDALSYTKQTEPLNGTATVNADGNYTYTPNSGYSGSDSFTIAISDGKCAVTTVVVHVTVSPANHTIAEMQLSKTALNVVNKAGDLIHYNLVVKNTGDVPLKNVVISDPGADAGSIVPSIIANLIPGAEISVTAAHTLTQAEVNSGSFSNQATLTADQDSGMPIPPVKSDDPITLIAGDPTIVQIIPGNNPEPAVQFSKTAINVVNKAGDLIHYNLVVKNTGDVPLKNVVISDPGADAGSIVPLIIANLIPGAEVSVTAVHTLTQSEVNSGSFSNQATLTADQDSGMPIPPVKSDDPNTPEPGDPTIVKITQPGSITLLKTAVLGNNAQTIVYIFNITNTGEVTLNTIQLTDVKLGLNGKAILVPDGLQPGSSVTYSEIYTLTQMDKDAGEVRNTALVTASDPKGVIVNDVSGTTAGNNTSTVTTLPKPPVATDDTAVTKVNTPVIINTLGNDNSGNTTFNKSTVTIISQPKNGTVSVNTDGTITYTPTPGYTGNDSFTYQVRDANGYLSNVANVSITSSFLNINVPNLFTPNGDGINDVFEIIGLNQFERSDLVIVNRWGNEVYRSGNYQNNWSGEGLNEGTYYYLLRVKRAGSQEWKIYKGYVTLIRAFKQ